MEENKFEKQVQQKMDELKIHPSDSVWEHVKNRIEKKKSRRWGFLLSLLIFVILLLGGYLLFNSRQHSFTEKQEVSSINFKKPGEKSLRLNKIQLNSLPGKDAKSGSVVKDNLNKQFTKDDQGLVQRKIVKKHSNVNMRVSINSSEAETVNLPENSDDIKSKQPAPETNDNVKSDVLSKVKNDHIENIEIAVYNINKDSLIIAKALVKQIDKQKDTSSDKPGNKKSFNSPSKSKWHFGFLISGGISHVGNQFLGLGYSTYRARDYLSTSPGGGSVQIPGPSKVKNSGSYTGGIFIEKDISKTKLSFGINYKVYNTSNNVGQKNDSTAIFDARNAVNRYHNHFNFIEFPLTVKIPLGKSTTIPVFWEGGIIISQLLSSNALQFNPNSGVYFKDNSLLNKTQTGFSTGISTSLFSNQKNSILFGPFLYYGASHVANEGLYTKKHFVYIGLELKFYPGKNNFRKQRF
jgi:hypothetical protein